MKRRILLDTNVVSELMRGRPDARVLDWFEQQGNAVFIISAITQAEILLGIALLPEGKRRDALSEAAGQMFREEFPERCLAFDDRAAAEYAPVVAHRTRTGQPISTEDAQIAAIALTHGLPLATRNVKDFARIAGLDLLNPWG